MTLQWPYATPERCTARNNAPTPDRILRCFTRKPGNSHPEMMTIADERRTAITEEIIRRTGIDEALIERLVRGFYVKVRSDPLLGPIFDQRIVDWEPHLQ